VYNQGFLEFATTFKGSIIRDVETDDVVDHVQDMKAMIMIDIKKEIQI